jgi:hypothetical protein
MMDLTKQFDLGYDGFLQANQETLEALTKAMEAGSGVDAASFTGGRALTPESLDTTLVNILHSTDEARLFQRLKKVPVKSVVHQWDVRDEVGADEGGWVPEGGDSEEADQTIERKYTTAKYLQTLRKVTLQAAQSNMIEDAMAIEQEAGALWIVRNVEKALFNGTSTFFSNQPDGLAAQIPDTHVIDLRGADAASSAFEDAMNEASRQIRDYYGVPTDMFTSTMVMQDVQALLRDRIRFGGGMNQGTGIFKDYPTPFGNIGLVDDVFLKESGAASASALTAKAPGAITIDSAVAGNSGSSFAAGDAGDYFYGVAGVNRYGEGAVTVSGSPTAVTVAAGEDVTFTVDAAAPAPTAYALYRSKKDAADSTDMKFVGYFAYGNGTDDTFIDKNENLPGTSSTYVLNLNTAYNAIEWVQFLPLMKFPLYPTNAAVYPFLMLLFGSLALKKPTQHVRIKNVSPSNLGWY